MTKTASALASEYDEYAMKTVLLFDEWVTPDSEQEYLRGEYAQFVRTAQGAAIRREGGSQHLTASAFVFNAERTHVLLCFHRKGQFWVQLGGHIEAADTSLADTALREAIEESGINGLTLVSSFPADLNRHDLGASFGVCQTHWDVGFVFVAPADAQPVTSDESEDVGWWPVSQLPDNTPHDFADRIAYAVNVVSGETR